MPVDNTMPSIPPIAWWPVSWSAAGTRRCRPCTELKARSPPSSRGRPPPLGERERQQLMQLGADLELRLVASGRHSRDAQAHLAHGAQRDRRAQGRRESSTWSCTGRAETTLHCRSS